MSHFGRSGPPDIKDTFSLLVLNVTFRTTADDLFPLFDKYGKVVDVFIPRDRRTGDSRGFAFVRYKYQDEAQKAVEKLDGRCNLLNMVPMLNEFTKEESRKTLTSPKEVQEAAVPGDGMSDYRDRDHRRRSRSLSRDRSERHRGKDGDRYRSRSRSRSLSRSASPGYRRDRRRDKYDDEKRRRSRSNLSASPARRSPSPRRSPSVVKSPLSRGVSPDARIQKERSLTPRSVSPRARRVSRSPSPRSEDNEGSEYCCLMDLEHGI
ncbi:hypothetical protein CASFOL_034615 [Castilleja foliolosa]|uniref:RRM domain-containing protein n=1 Tax=Castilleja foliolosa TaxID=1961234 RepID=A0ABD3BQI2_9LAMI